jgi:hypothetical protein
MKIIFARHWVLVLAAAVLAAVPLSLSAAKPETAETKVAAETVEFFSAMKSGDIEVKLIMKDSTAGTVSIKNNTKRPLTIKLPDAFATVPVAAQFGGAGGGRRGGGAGGMGGMGGGMGGMGGGNQGGGGGMGGMGGGMGGMGGGMGGMGGGMGGGGGLFNVAPEKAGKLKVINVCLEHGKKDPNPRVAYEIKPIESFNKDPKVIELVKMLARGELDQHSAQAAAWHLANGLTWEELANKVGVKHLNGSTEPYFTEEQLLAAHKIAGEAVRRAEENKSKSPGKESSLSQQ